MSLRLVGLVDIFSGQTFYVNPEAVAFITAGEEGTAQLVFQSSHTKMAMGTAEEVAWLLTPDPNLPKEPPRRQIDGPRPGVVWANNGVPC